MELFRPSLGLAALLTLLAAFRPLKGRADQPYEEFHLGRGKISDRVLREAIGILTVSSGVTKVTTFAAYAQPGAGDPNRSVDAFKTRPVSNFAYHSSQHEDSIAGYRFPIVDRSGSFIQIAIDPVADRRIWVSTADLTVAFLHTELYFGEFQKLGEFVDPFFGDPQAVRTLFQAPNPWSKATRISGPQFATLKVIAQKKGFVQVAHPGNGGGHPVPLGWLRIRDAQGRLQIWITNFDDC